MKQRVKLGFLIVLLLLFSLTSGCASTTPYRAHPTFREKQKDIKKIVLLPPKVEVFQIGAGGVKEKIDEWCEVAEKNVIAQIEQQLKKRPDMVIQPLFKGTLSQEKETNLEETQALFDAVSASIVLHTYGPSPHLFPEKTNMPNYTLGREVSELSEDADTFLFVKGIENISTTGRKALMTGAVILAAMAGVYIAPQGGVTYVSVALVDARNGSVLWFNHMKTAGSHDLRDNDSAAEIVKGIFKDFPGQ